MGEDARHAVDRLVGLIVTLSSGQKQITQTALDLQALALSKKREIKVQLDLSDKMAEMMENLMGCLEELLPRCSWCDKEEEEAERHEHS